LFGKFEAGAYELQIDKFLRGALTGSVIILNVVHKSGVLSCHLQEWANG
jgi:hypothetical protein